MRLSLSNVLVPVRFVAIQPLSPGVSISTAEKVNPPPPLLLTPSPKESRIATCRSGTFTELVGDTASEVVFWIVPPELLRTRTVSELPSERDLDVVGHRDLHVVNTVGAGI